MARGCPQATWHRRPQHEGSGRAGRERSCGLAAAHWCAGVELQTGGDGSEKWHAGGMADVVCAVDGTGA
eukprot:6798568-Prymnesium_polylepis.1